jgi:hypothetical protein
LLVGPPLSRRWAFAANTAKQLRAIKRRTRKAARTCQEPREAAKRAARTANRNRLDAPGTAWGCQNSARVLWSSLELQIREFVELSYVSGSWPSWNPKHTAAAKVRGRGFRVLLSYYVAEERGSVAVNCRRSQAVELNLSLSVVRIQRSACRPRRTFAPKC